MPQSLSQVIVHIILNTKDRQKWLDAAISPRLYAYLGFRVSKFFNENLNDGKFSGNTVEDQI